MTARLKQSTWLECSSTVFLPEVARRSREGSPNYAMLKMSNEKVGSLIGAVSTESYRLVLC